MHHTPTINGAHPESSPIDTPDTFTLPRQPSQSFTLNHKRGCPTLNIIIIHLRVLLATAKHHDPIPFSFSSRKVANLGLVLSSLIHSSLINLFAQVSNITLISGYRPRTSSAPTLHHPNHLRHSCSFIINVPPCSIVSIAATLKIPPIQWVRQYANPKCSTSNHCFHQQQ